jgi:hypothetical protein
MDTRGQGLTNINTQIPANWRLDTTQRICLGVQMTELTPNWAKKKASDQAGPFYAGGAGITSSFSAPVP